MLNVKKSTLYRHEHESYDCYDMMECLNQRCKQADPGPVTQQVFQITSSWKTCCALYLFSVTKRQLLKINLFVRVEVYFFGGEGRIYLSKAVVLSIVVVQTFF